MSTTITNHRLLIARQRAHYTSGYNIIQLYLWKITLPQIRMWLDGYGIVAIPTSLKSVLLNSSPYIFCRTVHLSATNTILLLQLVNVHYRTAVCCMAIHSAAALSSRGVGKFCDFRPKSPFISETLRDRRMFTMYH